MDNITFKKYEKIIFDALYNWLKEVEDSNPKLDKIQGIYFGVYESTINNNSCFVTYLVGMNKYDEYSKNEITFSDLGHYDYKAKPENVRFNFGENELNGDNFICILVLQLLKLRNDFPHWKIFNVPNITYGFNSGSLKVLNNKEEIESIMKSK